MKIEKVNMKPVMKVRKMEVRKMEGIRVTTEDVDLICTNVGRVFIVLRAHRITHPPAFSTGWNIRFGIQWLRFPKRIVQEEVGP